jgi:hypothetical protein
MKLAFAVIAAALVASAPAMATGFSKQSGGFSNKIGGYNDGKYVAAGGGAKGIAECKYCTEAKTYGGSDSGIRYDNKSVSVFSESGMTSTTVGGKGYNAATSDSYVAIGLGHGSGGVYGSATFGGKRR